MSGLMCTNGSFFFQDRDLNVWEAIEQMMGCGESNNTATNNANFCMSHNTIKRSASRLPIRMVVLPRGAVVCIKVNKQAQHPS